MAVWLPATPPPKRSKVVASAERALTTDELEREWLVVYEQEREKVKLLEAALSALEKLLEVEREERVAQEEEEEKVVDGLQERVWELEGKLEEQEKVRAHLKEEIVSRDREIATMREAISKLKKEK